MVPDPRSTRTIRPWLARVKRSSLLSMIGIIIVSSVKITAASDPFLNSRKSILDQPVGVVPTFIAFLCKAGQFITAS